MSKTNPNSYYDIEFEVEEVLFRNGLVEDIFVKITNDSNEGKTVTVKQGDGFAQAIFIPYGITYSDDASTVRNGGMGSTDAKR